MHVVRIIRKDTHFYGRDSKLLRFLMQEKSQGVEPDVCQTESFWDGRFYDVWEGIVSASKRERGVWLAESPPFGAVYHRSIYSRSEAARKRKGAWEWQKQARWMKKALWWWESQCRCQKDWCAQAGFCLTGKEKSSNYPQRIFINVHRCTDRIYPAKYRYILFNYLIVRDTCNMLPCIILNSLYYITLLCNL